MLYTTLSETRSKSGAIPLSLVAADLQECEKIIEATLQPFQQRFGPIVQHLKHYRGKRLRPVLLLLAGHASGTVTRHHHTLAAVVELIHTATLVHDDVLDEATTRRHVRTVNSMWGDRTSLLLGDMLFSSAFRLCSTVDAQACEWIGDATNRVCAGELLQVSNAGNLSLDEATYFEIVGGKTGALTECCTRLGTHYAGASQSAVEAMSQFGRELGIAFQIADDVLDLRGSEKVAGKTLGTDIEQQKLTLPIIRALVEIPNADELRMALKAGEVAKSLELIDATNAIESATNEAQRRIADACEALNLLSPSVHRKALEQIAEWTVQRDR